LAIILDIHPDNPQPRLVKQAAEMLRAGKIAVLPTDSCFALACHIGDKEAQERINRIRHVDKNHHFTLLCADLSELGVYASINKNAYRLLRKYTPGPYTFIMTATKEVPKRLANPKRKTIGLRVPDNRIMHAILAEMGEPLLSVTLIIPPEKQPLTEDQDILDRLDKLVDLIVQGGHCGAQATTVIDLEESIPKVLRRGRGECDF
jgi:tRNA threonylcarbamoyl adenosine modification protein (Sua5/YciO/YrdC/YwlC family)